MRLSLIIISWKSGRSDFQDFQILFNFIASEKQVDWQSSYADKADDTHYDDPHITFISVWRLFLDC